METTSATGPSLDAELDPVNACPVETTARRDWNAFGRSCLSPIDALSVEASLSQSHLNCTPSLIQGRPSARPYVLFKWVRVLHIPLLMAERGWAFGMQKKGEQAAMGHSLKRRGTMLRKFTQAVKASNALTALCGRMCDARTCLEAEGYSEMIKGISCMENDRKWNQALRHFTKTKKILEGLAKVSEVEVQSVFVQAVEELEPNLRFCRYQLEKSNEQTELPTFDELQARLAEMEIDVKPKAETVSALSITWCHNQYPVKNEKLSELLQTAQKHEKQITGAQLDHATLVGTYEKVIAVYTEMEANIKKALAAGKVLSVFSRLKSDHRWRCECVWWGGFGAIADCSRWKAACALDREDQASNSSKPRTLPRDTDQISDL